MKNVLYGIGAMIGWILGDRLGSYLSGYAPSPFGEISGMFAIFFIVRYLAYKITNEWGLPIWLQYKPFSCELCLTFWSLIVIYLTISLSLSCLYIGICGVLLAVMNALAMWKDQKDKTIIIID